MEDNLNRALFISWLRSRGARTALCPVPPTLSHLWKPRRLQLRKPPGSSLRCPGQAFNLPSAVPCSTWSLPNLCLLRACSPWLPVFRNWGQWSAFKNLGETEGQRSGSVKPDHGLLFSFVFSFVSSKTTQALRSPRESSAGGQLSGVRRNAQVAPRLGTRLGPPPPQPSAARAATGAGGYR